MSVKEDKLNKELCNLCNIQPKVIQDYEMNDIIIYPDFFNPNNFVKLMELKVVVKLSIGNLTTFLGEELVGDINKVFYDRKSFLESLISKLKDTKGPLMDKFRERIKHAKWEY